MLKKRIIPKILIKKKNLQNENIIVSLTTKKFKDNRIIGDPKSQATIFNECCQIYAPRYRQATLASFFNKENGLKARSFAFNDILVSFDEYIKKYNKGRPIIIAGHSQGAELGLRLL